MTNNAFFLTQVKPDRMQHSLEERVLTLAGVFQATRLVRRTAQSGRIIDSDIETCLRSILQTDTDHAEDIYGGAARLRLGLQTLIDQMGSVDKNRDMELTRYMVMILHLEHKLSKNRAMLAEIRKGIDLANSQAEYFNLSHTNVIASLANLYQNTISTLQPRIMVTGKPEILSDTENANLIRALLLAAIRSAVAWHQCGGGRLQLMFQRKRIVSVANDLLAKLPSINTLI
jgi:high frequency lysogenization protein